nr:NB-ARC domains-containing protein [Tanacetum cinerariifolium]
MAELILTALLPVIFEKLTSVAVNRITRSKEIHSELKKWERLLSHIQSFLEDASQKEVTQAAVKQWLNGLQHLAYDIDDVLDALATDAMSHEFTNKSEGMSSMVRKLIPACCTNFSLSTRMDGKLNSIVGREVTGISGMISLQTLSNKIVVENDDFFISWLKNIKNLQGNISIDGLDKVQSARDIREVNLSQKRVSELRVEWSEDINDARNETLENEVMDALKPHSDNLKDLLIESYGGKIFPNWIGNPSFLLLTCVQISGCRKCTFLPPLGQLPSLKKLVIQSLNEVKVVGSEFLGTVFPRLQTLAIEDCPNLVDVSFEALPSMRVLRLNGCGDGVLTSLIHAASAVTKLSIWSISGLSDEVWRGVMDYLGAVEEIAREDTAATDHVLAAATRRDTIRFEDVVSTISKEYLLEFTLEYGIPEILHSELPSPEEPIVEFPDGKVGVYTKFFEFANYHERIFLTVVEWRINSLKDKMPPTDSYSEANVTTLNTHRTPIQKQPKALLCLVGLSRSYFLRDDVYPTFLYDDNQGGALNPTKVKTETRARAVHEVPLVTATTSRVIDMDDMDVALGSSGTPPALEKSPLDFADEDPPQIITEREYPRRKSLAPLGLDAGSTFATPVTQDTPAAAKSVSDPGPLSYAKPQPHPEIDIAQESRVREINLLPLHGWVARRYLSSEVGCDKQLPPGHPGRVPRHDGSHSTARSFQAKDEDIKKLDQEIKSLRAVEAKIHSLRNQTKNLKTLLEAEVDMKKAAEAKNAELAKELESHRIPIYPEVCDSEDPWACKEEMMLEDAIAANKSRAEKKKKCGVVCRIHGIGFAHHARSNGIPVSVPTIAPRGLAILLADAAIQTKVADKEDEPHLRL